MSLHFFVFFTKKCYWNFFFFLFLFHVQAPPPHSPHCSRILSVFPTFNGKKMVQWELLTLSTAQDSPLWEINIEWIIPLLFRCDVPITCSRYKRVFRVWSTFNLIFSSIFLLFHPNEYSDCCKHMFECANILKWVCRRASLNFSFLPHIYRETRFNYEYSCETKKLFDKMASVQRWVV